MARQPRRVSSPRAKASGGKGRSAAAGAGRAGAKSAEKSTKAPAAQSSPRSVARSVAKSATRPASATDTKPVKSRSRAAASPGKPGRQKAALASDQLLSLYEKMLLIRRFEERAGQLYGQGEIAGFCHLYIGQEAVAVGMQANLEPHDTVITTYRDHGHMLACDADPKAIMAELTGRRGGCSKGKGGSMHMFDPARGFYGGHGIVGASVPLGAGLAFMHRYRGQKGVSLTYYGDGAANQGQVLESFNMAALWKLPVIFIVENNQYGMGTSVERASASPDFFRRGEPYGIPGEKVDGMDVLAVMEAGQRAIAHARAGKGPVILQMETYRYRGHSMSDPARYRTRSEVQKVRDERDPLDALSNHLLRQGLADGEALKAIDQRIKAIVKDAADFALSEPEPDPRELYTDVLADDSAASRTRAEA